MSLDVNTPKGQESLKHEKRSVEILNKHYPDIFYANTPKDSAATIDAVLIAPFGTHGLVVCGVAEQKSRNMTYHQLKNWDFEWLVTDDKLQKSWNIAKNLCVSLFGLLYLVPDDCLLLQELCNKEGEWTVKYDVRNTETQETINGGKVFRDNAYIDMSKAEILK
jgi:hypothetical protein